MIRKSQSKAVQFVVTAAVAIASLAALPAHAISDTATASGTVVAPITITAANNLAFGTFASGTGGTVTVSTSGLRSVGGAVLAIGGTPAAARFDIVGVANSIYTIALSGPGVLVKGADSMALSYSSSLSADNTTATNVSSGTLSAAGLQSLYVGGTLTVASNQALGVYNGSIIATVEYQ